MRLSWAVGTSLVCWAAAMADTPPFQPPSLATLVAKAQKQATIAKRIDAASQALLGAPFEDAPLGEGPGSRYDTAPAFRLDAFDCTTYVETVIAAARTPTLKQFESTLAAIRYHGSPPSYLNRNHLPCVDWISHNTRQKVLTDITHLISGGRWPVKVAARQINKAEWFANLPLSTVRVTGLNASQQQARLEELKNHARRFKPVQSALPYIELGAVITQRPVSEQERARRLVEEKQIAQVPEESRKPQHTATPKEVIDLRLKYLIQDTDVDAQFLAAIPSGTLMNIVRPRWTIPGTALNITHQGWVIQKPQGTFFRHVSRSGGRAKDVPLDNYLRLCLLIPSIEGLNFQRINPSTPNQS